MTRLEVPTLLLFGSNGQIGQELSCTLQPLGRVVPLSRRDVDLVDLGAVRTAIRSYAPNWIVNAAAFTAVDRAEAEQDTAWRVNADAPRVIAEEARRCGARVVHFSTDYVFDGRSARAYTEDDTPGPLNVYGSSKLAGEHAIREAGGTAIILRTSWVYGASGQNFLRTMLRLGAERDELRVVDDQYGAPTWSRLIAESTARIVEAVEARKAESEGVQVFHLTAAGETTWYEFARTILAASRSAKRTPSARVIPLSTEEYGAPATRPRRSVLDNRKIERIFGIRMSDWREPVARVVGEAEHGIG